MYVKYAMTNHLIYSTLNLKNGTVMSIATMIAISFPLIFFSFYLSFIPHAPFSCLSGAEGSLLPQL